MASLDWSQCPAVESIPGKVSGAWVFRGTRMPVQTVFENLEAGRSVDEITEVFDVTPEEVKAVLHFANESLAKYKRLFADVTIGAHESLATVLAAGRQRVVAAAQPPALPAPEIIPEPVAPEPSPALVEPVVDVKPLDAPAPSQASTKTAPLPSEMSAEDRNRAFFDFTTGRVVNG